MHTILITGGAGFIGCNFVRFWLDTYPHRVVNLDKLTYAGNLDSLADVAGNRRYEFVQGDIADGPLLVRLLERLRPQYVVNLAAESHVDRSIDGPAEFVQTNVVGLFRLLEAVRGYWQTLDSTQASRFRLLHVSTDEVYGSLGPEGAFCETTACAPSSPYAASKAAGDHFARAYHHTYGLPVLVTHCSNNYGPYQFPEKLVPLMVLNALEGRPLPVYGDGQHVRDWLHVEDHCRALHAVLTRAAPGETYGIGGNCERTNLEVVHAICATIDRLRPDLPHAPCSSLIEFVPDRPGHDRRYAIDASKIRRDLDWTPAVNFDLGLESTIRWYVDHLRWCERVTTGKYRRERLGRGEGGARGE